MSRPVAVAITGSIGAGKSEALRAFERHGAATISSDEIVHRLLREDDEVRRELLDRWGDEILAADGDGEIDRSAVARIVFADRDELTWLESLLHPRVVQAYLAWREELAALPEPPAVCATEVPLLFEVGGETRFDAVVVVTAPPGVRKRRANVPIEQRSDRLIPDDTKVSRADFSFTNTGTLEDLDAFVAEVVRKLSSHR